MKKTVFIKYFSAALLPALLLALINSFMPGFFSDNKAAVLVVAVVSALAVAYLIYIGESGETSGIGDFLQELQKEKEELQEIISSIKEPIMVTDNKGIIVLANRSFEKISTIPDPEGNHFSETIDSSAFNAFLGDVISKEKSSSTSLEIDKCYFFVSASYLDTGREVSVLFQDITQLKNLEKIKRDFVSNVSHEIKTPLTAIKGFADTLEVEIEEKNRHYLDIIKRHTERLINIVNDLLILSELEEKDVIEISRFSIREMATDMMSMFKKEAQPKGIELKTVVDTGLDEIMADRGKIEQLLINLTSNAVKYTDEGTVTIKASRDGRDLILSVSDTGTGINEKHISRIFERFYRVSKSRSRESGGTGLGLAIVKHIALQHKGEVRAESNPGKGSLFSVRLPHAVAE